MKNGAALVKTLLFTIFVPGTVFGYAPLVFFGGLRRFPPANPIAYAGFLPIVAGVLLYLRCAWDFATKGDGTPAPIDAPKTLVVAGLYRYVRNPMYVGVVSTILGEALLFTSRGILLYAGIAFLFFNSFVFLYEEPTLEAKFSETYRDYKRNVPRWIPRARPWEPAGDATGKPTA